jgi:hypothetical protein
MEISWVNFCIHHKLKWIRASRESLPVYPSGSWKSGT